MNENIDLTKILKNCPKETELYSPMYGKVYFNCTFYSGEDGIIYCYKTKLRKGCTRPINPQCTDIVVFYNNGTTGNLDFNITPECMLFPSKDQRDWSKFTTPWLKKERLVKPKFKVGDIIRHKETNKDDVYEISKVYDDSYGIAGFTWMLYMKYQDQYELVPNKFDPKTLKPFDKVLVRDSYKERWLCRFFSHIIDGVHIYKYITIGSAYKYCIPYNDDTKHLVGTKEEAPEFYRYWQD